MTEDDKEGRTRKGWWKYYIFARADRTNSNISSYVKEHFIPGPTLYMLEGLAAALGWPIDEARASGRLS